jgi:FlaA1/EpsC-like NDP-sugar epimerase
MGGYSGGHHRRFNYARTKEWKRGHIPYKCCKDKHVVVTGGAAGIGFELAKEAIARGASKISIIDISDCTRAVRKLKDEANDGVSAVFVAKVVAFNADVSNFAEVCFRCRYHSHLWMSLSSIA